jgi:hypothetical protein
MNEINGRAGWGPFSIFLTNRSEAVHQQQSPAAISRALALLLTRQMLVSTSFVYTSSLGRILPQSVHNQTVSLQGFTPRR